MPRAQTEAGLHWSVAAPWYVPPPPFPTRSLRPFAIRYSSTPLPICGWHRPGHRSGCPGHRTIGNCRASGNGIIQSTLRFHLVEGNASRLFCHKADQDTAGPAGTIAHRLKIAGVECFFQERDHAFFGRQGLVRCKDQVNKRCNNRPGIGQQCLCAGSFVKKLVGIPRKQA